MQSSNRGRGWGWNTLRVASAVIGHRTARTTSSRRLRVAAIEIRRSSALQPIREFLVLPLCLLVEFFRAERELVHFASSQIGDDPIEFDCPRRWDQIYPRSRAGTSRHGRDLRRRNRTRCGSGSWRGKSYTVSPSPRCTPNAPPHSSPARPS